MIMSELFDYGVQPLPLSDEVIEHILDEELMSTDWRQRASNHFREYEMNGSVQGYNAAIGALAIAVSNEKIIRSTSQIINYLEVLLQLPHYGAND